MAEEYPDAKPWCERALKAVLQLWDPHRHQGYWDATDHQQYCRPVGEAPLRPTVTFNAILAFADTGLFLPETQVRKGILECEPAQLQITGIDFVPRADAILQRIIMSDEWVTEVLNSSSHAKAPRSTRALVVLAPMLAAIRALTRYAPDVTVQMLRERLKKGTKQVAEIFTNELFQRPERLTDEFHRPDPQWKMSPQLAHYAAVAITKCITLERTVFADRGGETQGHEAAGSGTSTAPTVLEVLEPLRQRFRTYFLREIDRHLARKLDPSQLAFALHGLRVLDESERYSPVFREGVRAVVEGRLPDGCWPPGATVAFFERSGGEVRQPSVEIALQLAGCTVRRSALFRCEPFESELLKVGLPALKQQLAYLARSYQNLGKYTGWEDDRLRASGVVRMHINAQAARLANAIRSADVILERERILAKYKHEYHARAEEEAWRGPPTCEERWEKDVIEPDTTIKPCQKLRDKIIKPIAGQMQLGYYFLRPAKDGVSLILYGPPGSGKTYLLNQFAAALGWPLVSLSPGDFIREGLERIESAAREIFDDLRRLDHAVVLFDECDELFRKRPKKPKSTARNILSFATASMLPKLQQLHDARKVVFVLATNFIRNLDMAVRREGRFDLLLLFDRPDESARLQLAHTSIESARAGLSAMTKQQIEEIATKVARHTAGRMTKQVIDLAKAAGKAGGWSRELKAKMDGQSVSDYQDWCQREGEDELKAAQASAAIVQAKKAQWKPVLDEKSAG
jgi:hypothetical protein